MADMNDGAYQRKVDDVAACDILHQVAFFYSSTKKPHDYGTGEPYTAVETHIIKYIADHPGITLTEMAYDFGKTKGTVSQLLRKLEVRGLIIKTKAQGMDNRQFLELSEKGQELNKAHAEYDASHFGESMSMVREKYSDQEIDKAFEILKYWLVARRKVHKIRLARKAEGER